MMEDSLQNSTPRLSRIEKSDANEAQLEAINKLLTALGKPNGRLANLYAMMVRQPEIALRLGAVGAYCRFHASPAELVREAAILTACYVLDFEYEVRAHEEIIQNRGMSAFEVDALKLENWDALPVDISCAARFVRAALSRKTIDDALVDEVIQLFGEEGLLDLTVMAGHYNALSVFGLVLQPEIDPPGHSLTKPGAEADS